MSYFAKRYHPPGTAPGTLVEHEGVERHPLRVTVVDYTAEALAEHPGAEVTDCLPYLQRDSVTWIHVQGHPEPESLRALAGPFELHPLALEDVVNTGQRPKLERYEEQIFLALGWPVAAGDGGLAVEQVSVFMGAGYVVSFHPGHVDPFEPVRQRLRRSVSRLRGRGADYLLYALVDLVIDQGFPVLERIGDEVESLESEILDGPGSGVLGRLHQLRRNLLLLRRALWPHRELISLLQRDDTGLIDEETGPYLRDCYDHAVQILDLLETYREMTASLLEVHLSTASNRLNETMRFLTVISTFFIPLTFLAGVFGMNFGRGEPRSPWAMPELDWYYGYPLAWLLMLAVGAGMLAFFRRRGWL